MTKNLRYLPPFVLLTSAYLLFCLLVGLLLPKCSTDCEDSASSYLTWTTDFFVAVVCGAMSLRLYRKSSHKRMAGLAFLFQYIAFAIRGLLGKNYGEHGINTSGEREDGFYIWTIFLYLCWTASALLYAFLVFAALIKSNENADGLHCGLLESRILFSLITLSFLAIATGCIWNALTMWNTNVDEDSSEEKIPIRIMKYGQLFWHGFYCAFLIVAAYVWRAAVYQSNATVGGFSPNFATAGIVISQVVVACIVVAYTIDIANNGDFRGPNSSEEIIYAELVFNYSMLMSGHFIQSTFLALFHLAADAVKDEGSTDDDSAEGDDASEDGTHAPGNLEKMQSQMEEGRDEVYVEQKDSSKSDYTQEFLPTCMTHGKVMTFFVGSTNSVDYS